MKKNKFNAKKCGKFASKKEANRYAELSEMQEKGLISYLQTQVPYELIPKQRKFDGKCERSVKYIADFVYVKDGHTIVEDVKGYRKGGAYSLFVIKRKLLLQRYGLEIKEV